MKTNLVWLLFHAKHLCYLWVVNNVKGLTLYRVYSGEEKTLGVLVDFEGAPFAVTLEPPLVLADDGYHTQPNISCIPIGHYRCKRVQSPRFGDTFEITNVPGRSHILLHKGNRSTDTLGCVLVAENFSEIGIGQSAAGFREFMEMMDRDSSFNLTIKEI